MTLLLVIACAQSQGPSSPEAPSPWREVLLDAVPEEPRALATHGERVAIAYDDGRVWVDGQIHETGLEQLYEVDVSACCVVASSHDALWWLDGDGTTRTVATPECLGCSPLALSDDGLVVYGPLLLLPDGTKRELYGPAVPHVVSWDGPVLYGATYEHALTWNDVLAMPEVTALPKAPPLRMEGPYLLRGAPLSSVIDVRTGETTLEVPSEYLREAIRADGRAVLGPLEDVSDAWGSYDTEGLHLLSVGMIRHGAFLGDDILLVSTYGAVGRYHGGLPMSAASPRDERLPVDEQGAVEVDGLRLAADLRVHEDALRVGDLVVFAGWQEDVEAVVAVDGATGRERWRHILEENDDIDVFHRVGDDVVFGEMGGPATLVAPDGTVRATFYAGFADPIAARSRGVLGTVGEHAITLGGREIDVGYEMSPRSIAVHPEGFVVGYEGGLQEVWSPDGQRVSSQGLVHQQVAWKPDGTLVTAGLDGHLTELGTDGTVLARHQALEEPIHHLAMVGGTVVVGGHTSLSVGGTTRPVEGLQAIGKGTELSWADDDVVYQGDRTHDVWMVDELATSSTGRLAVRNGMSVQLVGKGAPTDLAVEAEAIAWAGDRLLVATAEGLVDGERPGAVLVPATDVRLLSVARDVVATGAWRGEVALWTLDGVPLFRRMLPGLVDDVEVAPDGQHVAVALHDGTVRLLDREGQLQWVARFTGEAPTIHEVDPR